VTDTNLILGALPPPTPGFIFVVVVVEKVKEDAAKSSEGAVDYGLTAFEDGPNLVGCPHPVGVGRLSAKPPPLPKIARTRESPSRRPARRGFQGFQGGGVHIGEDAFADGKGWLLDLDQASQVLAGSNKRAKTTALVLAFCFLLLLLSAVSFWAAASFFRLRVGPPTPAMKGPSRRPSSLPSHEDSAVPAVETLLVEAPAVEAFVELEIDLDRGPGKAAAPAELGAEPGGFEWAESAAELALKPKPEKPTEDNQGPEETGSRAPGDAAPFERDNEGGDIEEEPAIPTAPIHIRVAAEF